MNLGLLSFAWNASKGSLGINCETQHIAVDLIWRYIDNSFAAAGRERDLELLEIHAIDTGVTYNLGRRMMNTKLC
ncbi:hypothetical protein H6F90_12240 [Trichocoleus sp. FACHB-591]|uniref:hypothetical protein n=1 Tax=Trichocoleus sp. FACHB-591 TaxID=2692872 RepID=UPI001686DCBE|nr:hypothetical protein [Trichocoleus sp. FACHB-591]MBD2095917.1 hypothetical protein [Trichocoleus sp. FACHB-591]